MSKRLAFVATVLFCALGITWAVSQIKLNPDQHLAASECASCHIYGDQTKPNNAHQLTGSQEKLCVGCHPNALEASHPSGFRPTSTFPANFPLDWKGEMTCSTCHLIHASEPGLMRTKARGKELCFSCHEEQFFEQMADGGQSLLISGHLAEASDYGEIGLDAYSINCMNCHAELGESLQVNISLDGVMSHSGGRVNHPVGVNYDEATKFGGYRSSALLPKEIKFPEGKISCISCHQVYTENHGKIVLANTGIDLCLTCHDL